MNINLTKEEKSYINEVWHISKAHSHDRYERLLYTTKWFMEKYPIYKGYSKSIYLLVIDETQVIKYNGEQNKCTKLKRK